MSERFRQRHGPARRTRNAWGCFPLLIFVFGGFQDFRSRRAESRGFWNPSFFQKFTNFSRAHLPDLPTDPVAAGGARGSRGKSSTRRRAIFTLGRAALARCRLARTFGKKRRSMADPGRRPLRRSTHSSFAGLTGWLRAGALAVLGAGKRRRRQRAHCYAPRFHPRAPWQARRVAFAPGSETQTASGPNWPGPAWSL